MTRLVVFLDLDDTILQTAPKCPPDQSVEPAATNRAGAVLSFMTSGQRRLLEVWMEQGLVIPVTGRTEDALARVMIAFRSWRITHHGAVIRQPDGQLPAWWHERVAPRLAAAQTALQAVTTQLGEGAAAGGYRVSRHTLDRLVTYISVKTDLDEARLIALRETLEATGLPPELSLHHNGNNLALSVVGARKQDAVRQVIAELERAGPIVTLGAGDSLTDIPFLRVCDFALTPRDSQIQRQTWGDVSI